MMTLSQSPGDQIANSHNTFESPNIPGSRPLSILFLIDELEALHGGSEQQVIQLIQLLKRSGEHVELAILRGTEWLSEAETGCPIHFCRVASIKTPSGLRALWRLSRWMRQKHFDAIQTMFVEANLLGPWLAKLAGVPLVLGSRRNLNYWMNYRVALFQSLSNRLATRLVANSDAVKQAVSAIEKTREDKIDVLYNGINCAHFLARPELRKQTRKEFSIPDGALLVGCISAFRPVKGVDVLVRAAAIVNRSNPDLRFMLVGDGPALAEMGQLSAELRTPCLFPGGHRNVLPFLSAFDIAVLPSRSEGFSNSLLEYMAAGLPVVATDVGGNRETLEHTGLLVPANDAESLANAILSLASDRNLRERLGAAAQRRVREFFDLEDARKRLYDYFRTLAIRRGILNPE